jgi:tetratricopeptide (TPR) repeat protein
MATNSEIEKLERRWQENPLGLTFAPLAEAYRKSGEVAKALELLEAGLAQHPNYVPAHIVRGRCHADARNIAQAEASFRRVTELDPGNAIALKGLADLAESEGRVSEAISSLEAMLEVDRNNEDARGQLDRLRELPPAPAAVEEPEVVILEMEELSPVAEGEFQLPDDSFALGASEEPFPEFVLQERELEKSLPVPEAAQGSDMIGEPDPLVAQGLASTDEESLAELIPELELRELESEAIWELEPPQAVAEPTAPAVAAEPEAAPAPEPEAAPEAEPEATIEPASPPASPEPFAEPEPVAAQAEPELMVTETMAEIFLRQGHRELALAVYSQLAQRDPANQRVADAFAILQAELVPPPPPPPAPPPVEEPKRYDAASTGGRSVGQWFGSLLSAERPSVAPPIHPPTFEVPRRPTGEPTRPAPQALSLGAVFGEGAPPAGPAGGLAEANAAEPSFEQFFAPAGEAAAEAELPKPPETGSPAMSALAPEDLEQFNAWLRGLKR